MNRIFALLRPPHPSCCPGSTSLARSAATLLGAPCRGADRSRHMSKSCRRSAMRSWRPHRRLREQPTGERRRPDRPRGMSDQHGRVVQVGQSRSHVELGGVFFVQRHPTGSPSGSISAPNSSCRSMEAPHPNLWHWMSTEYLDPGWGWRSHPVVYSVEIVMRPLLKVLMMVMRWPLHLRLSPS